MRADAQAWFARELRQLLYRAGSPSVRDLARSTETTAPGPSSVYEVARQAGVEHKSLPRSTIQDLLQGKGASAPDAWTVSMFVLACASWGQRHGSPVLRELSPPAVGRLLAEWQQRRTDYENLLSTSTSEQPPGPTDRVDRPDRHDLSVLAGRAQIREIAPAKLFGRERELADLAGFCAGHERYQLWQAPPWAGKTALAAWFALNPPDGVSVVPFLVMRRRADQADSDAFTTVMVDQLAALAQEDVQDTVGSSSRVGLFHHLLAMAAKAVHRRDGRLVLLVDGLDEDVAAFPGSGKPSIANLLPKAPPENVRIAVTSRHQYPEMPHDLPGDHPLRTCVRVALSPSPDAEQVRHAAEHELRMLLADNDPLHAEILALLVASGGGLSCSDFATLTRRPSYQVETELVRRFGRSLTIQSSGGRYDDDEGENRYIFAHDALREHTARYLADLLPEHRRRIDGWAQTCLSAGWPPDTPRYLLRPYSRLLAREKDTARLVELATDAQRHDRMLAATNSDGDAVVEIDEARRLVLERSPADLLTLGTLAVHQGRLVDRSDALPSDLPALWVALGGVNHAEALLSSFTEEWRRDTARVAMVDALLGRGDLEGARRHAVAVLDADLAQAAVDRVDRALEAQVGQCNDGPHSTGGSHEADNARQYRKSHSGPDRGPVPGAMPANWGISAALADQVVPLVRNGRYADAADVLRLDHADTDTALSRLVDILVGMAEWDHAKNIAGRVEDDVARERVLSRLADTLREAGEWDRSLRVALAISDGRPPATYLMREYALAKLVRTVAEIGDWDKADMILRTMAPFMRNQGLKAIVETAARRRDWDRAERAAFEMDNPGDQDPTLAGLVEQLAEAPEQDRAESIARRIVLPFYRADALVSVACSYQHIDPQRSRRLAIEAETVARTERTTGTDPVLDELTLATTYCSRQASTKPSAETGQEDEGHDCPTLAARAVLLARRGKLAQARQIVEVLRSPYFDSNTDAAVAALAVSYAQAKKWRSAEKVLGYMHLDPGGDAAIALVGELAAAGRWDHAERIVKSLSHPPDQIKALGVILGSLTAGWHDQTPSRRERGDDAAKTKLGTRRLIREARRIAASISDRTERVCAVASVDVRMGRRDVAEHTVLSLQPASGPRDRALKDFVTLRVARQEWERAEDLANGIQDAELRTEAFTEIIRPLIATRDGDALRLVAAAQCVAELQHNGLLGPGQALIELAVALASVEEWAMAEETAQLIKDPHWRGTAMVLIGLEMLEAARDRNSEDLFGRNRQLLAKTLATDGWTNCMVWLAETDREAALRLGTYIKRLELGATRQAASAEPDQPRPSQHLSTVAHDV